jgi:selenocysteine-specific translation elongation factor
MKSANFVVLGDSSIAGDLGKKGNSTDITIYDRKTPEKILSFVVPSGFPEKIQPLLQSIALAECAIVNVKNIDRALGEQIVALDSAKMQKGFIVANGMDDEVKKIIKSTVLESYQFVSLDELKKNIESMESSAADGPVKVLVDASFEVKGVGTVALGVVRKGTLKKYDELEMMPQKKTVLIRSIQMHDDEVDQTQSPGRVGTALKGMNADEIERGSVIAAKDSIKSSNTFKIQFEKSKFYREEINSSSSYHLCIGLQVKPVKVDVSSGLTVTSEKPFAYESGERCVILDLNSKSSRIVGGGNIL